MSPPFANGVYMPPSQWPVFRWACAANVQSLRCRPAFKCGGMPHGRGWRPTNASWQVDETYLRVAEKVDGNPAYPKAISELKRAGELSRRCRCRPVRYLNNIVEQDHRSIKRRVRASQGFRSFHSAARTIEGIETINMIRKGQVRWLAPGDIVGQVAFVTRLFDLTPAA